MQSSSGAAAGGEVWFSVDEDMSTLQASEETAEYLLFDTSNVSDCSRGPPKYNEGRVVERFPYANLFQDRTDGKEQKGVSGTVKIYGGAFSPPGDGKRGVVWMNTQMWPCPSGKYSSDTREKRIANFGRCLQDLLEKLPTRPKSLAMPKLGIACSFEPDTWKVYMQTLKLWAMQNKIRVRVTKALYEKVDGKNVFDKPYDSIPEPKPLPGQSEYLQKLFIARPDVGTTDYSSSAALHDNEENEAAPLPKSDLDFSSNLAFLAGMAGMPAAPTAAPPAPAAPMSAFGIMSMPGVPPVPAALAPAPAPAASAPVKEEKLKYAFPKHVTPPAVKWTAKSWFQAKVQDPILKPGRIQQLRTLTQGSPEWLHEKRELINISSTDFKNFAPTFNKLSKHAHLRDALKKKLWWTIFEGNAWTKYGNDHEDDGMNITKKKMELDVFSELDESEEVDKCGFKYVTAMNHEVETAWAEDMDNRAFWAFEKTDEHGINMHIGNLIMSTSYDGLFWVVNPDTGQGEWIYVEIKCPRVLYDHLCVDHWCQVVGSMGILRRQGIDVKRCLYAAWSTDRTRIWDVPFDQEKYNILEKEVLDTFMNTLLPLYVQRDNGELEWGTLGAALEGCDKNGVKKRKAKKTKKDKKDKKEKTKRLRSGSGSVTSADTRATKPAGEGDETLA